MSGAEPVRSEAPAADSLLPGDHAALADLAFGSLSRTALSWAAHDGLSMGRHLALLPADALELDLGDPQQRRLGDYELLELIGEGGMGVVYRARQLSLDREVAVKLLAAGPWASREFIERFRREAQNSARMQHPNIVTVYEVGTAEELHFFSMRLVQGHSLATALRRDGPLAARRAATLMRTIAEAVDYAHRLNVLHLDLKPANVLLDETGVPHVADFGLARRLDHALALDNTEISGTPSYMAPEQASLHQHKLSVATDIWGLGAILYELLTGQPPFRGDNAQATLQLVQDGELRRPRRAQPQLPIDIEAITLRCLAREPAERYPSARALADDLSRFIEGRAVRARPLNVFQRIGRWTLREPKLAATALLALGALLLGLLATTQQWRRAELNARDAEASAGTANARLWDSRDAAALAAMEAGNGWKAAPLLLANVAEMEARGEPARALGARKRLGIIENANPRLLDVLPAPDSTSALAFSADGRHLAAGSTERELRLFDLAGDGEGWRRLPDADGTTFPPSPIAQLAFDATARTLQIMPPPPAAAAPRPPGFGMSRVDAEHGRAIAPPAGFNADAAYSADGRHAVLWDSTQPLLQAWSTAPWQALGLPREVHAHGSGPLRVAPGGGFVAFRDADPVIQLLDIATLSPRARVDLGDFGRLAAWSFSADARWLALGDHEGHVLVLDCIGHVLHALVPRPFSSVRWLTFSDDGQWLAAATGKGGVYLWQWPEGRLLAPPFGAALSTDHVTLDRARGLVLTSGDRAAAALWQIAPAPFEMDRGEAVQLGDRITTLTTGYAEPIAWQAALGLIAHVGAERVRVERLPPPVLKAAPAAPLKPTTLRFDGHRLVVVEGSRVQLIDALSEARIGAPFEFPQPPGFAELTADGATLVVSSGRRLYAYDMASGAARFAPIELANSPQQVELSPDGQRLATAWLEHVEGVGAVAELWSLADGRRLGAAAHLPGPLDALLFSADGQRLLAWNHAALSLRDGNDLVPIAGPLRDLRTPAAQGSINDGFLVTAAFDHAGDVLVATAGPDADQHWGGTLERHPADGGPPAALAQAVLDRIVPIPGSAQLLALPNGGPLTRLDPAGDAHALPDEPDGSDQSAVAVSADGRWLARARRDGVALFDARDGTRLATLHTPLAAPDLVWQLAFSTDGNRLLGRSLRNRQLVWDLTPDTRSVSAIERELGLRDVAAPGAGERGGLDDHERAALRTRDPGPPAPPPPAATQGPPGGPIAPRDPATPPELLDLTPWYNLGLGAINRASLHSAGDFGWLPQGVQRLLGTDYDLRGGIQLYGARGLADVPRGNLPQAVRIPLPGRRIDAVDTLLLLNVINQENRSVAIARVELGYADGSRAVLPIRLGSDAWDYRRISELGTGARLAALGLDARGYAATGRPARVYAVHLANPHPQRPLASLSLAAGEESGGAPLFLAVTVPPAAAQR